MTTKLKAYDGLKKIADNLRTKFDKKFPDELTKEDIDASVREVFPRYESFAKFLENASQAALLVNYSRGTEGHSLTEVLIAGNIHTATKSLFKDIHRRMFADLYETGGKR